jgi:hypothetical protein
MMRIVKENHEMAEKVEQRIIRRRAVNAFCEAMAGNVGSGSLTFEEGCVDLILY